MSKSDDLMRTIEAIHAAGLDAELWPQALEASARLIGGIGATFEVLDKHTKIPTAFFSWGIPKVSEMKYMAEFAALSPRSPMGFRQGTGEIGYDQLVLDEAGMNRDPFYADFLGEYGFRYFISVNAFQDGVCAAPLAVQRSTRQGHVGRREIALMQRLSPHLQQAYDVARRLSEAKTANTILQNALDWLADGVMFVDTNGKVHHSNDVMQEIARRGDGIRIAKGQIEFSNADTRTRFNEALNQISRLRAGTHDAHPCDFAVLRKNGAPPYIVSVRPLTKRGDGIHESDAQALIFVHDPLKKSSSAANAAREVFGLTEAEAALAAGLQSGQTLIGYARAHRMSHNTVYWHLRRIKDKTGCTQIPELIRKLNELQVRVRP